MQLHTYNSHEEIALSYIFQLVIKVICTSCLSLSLLFLISGMCLICKLDLGRCCLTKGTMNLLRQSPAKSFPIFLLNTQLHFVLPRFEVIAADCGNQHFSKYSLFIPHQKKKSLSKLLFKIIRHD